MVCEILIILTLLCVIMLTEKLTESFGFITVVDAICYFLNTGLNIGIFVVSGQLHWKIVVIHIWKMVAPMLGIVGIHMGEIAAKWQNSSSSVELPSSSGICLSFYLFLSVHF